MNRNSRTLNSVKNIAASFCGKIVSMIFSFICRMVFVRYLSAEYLGVNGMFTSILSVLSLAELGIGSAIIFELYRALADENEEEISAYMHFYSIAYRVIGVVIGIVGLVLIPFLPYIVTEPGIISDKLTFYFCLYIFNTASSYFFSYKATILIADQKNYVVTLVNNCIVVIQNILQIISIITIHNFTAYLVIQILCTFINNIIISKIANRRYPYIAKKSTYVLAKDKRKRLVTNLKALFISKVNGTLVNSTDNIIIGAFVNVSVVGVTSNFTLLTSSLNSIITPIFDGLTASVGNFNVCSTKDSRIKLFNAINLMNFWLYGWAAVSFAILGNDIVRVFFGNSYMMETKVVIVMAINFYMVGMSEAVWLFRKTLGLFKYGRWINIFTGAINIVCSILLGRIWGVFGILLATTISRGLTNAWYDPYAVYKHGFEISPWTYAARYLKMAMILIFNYLLLSWMGNFFLLGTNADLLWKVLICIVVPNLTLYIFYGKSEEFKMILSKITTIIRRGGYR